MHREEREFSIVFHVSAEFSEEYAGDDDGFAWYEHFEQVLKPRLAAAVFDAIRNQSEFQATAAPRGRDRERALEIGLVRRFSA
jgi:hypothetical protein